MSLATSYTFYPVVRRGYRPDERYDPGTSPDARGTIDVELTVRGSGDGSATDTASVDLRLYGPGDVVGLDERGIVRTEPEPDVTSFPPNYFPVVEFDAPDLPWLFSPRRADDRGRNRPWLCLAALDQDHDGVTFSPAGTGPLPTAEAPVDELPDPAESWAWAHAQVAGDPPDDLSELFDPPESERAVSRLVCPRNLEADTRYRACLVPTFEPGRRAGLGLDPGSGMDLAWDGSDGTVRLPVYHFWEFSTDSEGDFEALARELDPVDFGPEVGYRKVDVTNPGPPDLKLAAAGDQGTIGMGGALKSPDAEPDEYENETALRELLNDPTDVVDETAFGAVGPPLYGRWHAGVRELEEKPDPWNPEQYYYPLWFNELNVAPSYRIAAGLGAQAVRNNQAALMASAWDQFPDLDVKNDWMKRWQFAREASKETHETLGRLDVGQLLSFTSPVHADVSTADASDGTPRTLQRVLDESDVPTELATPAFRRITRSRGDLARRPDAEISASTLANDLETGQTPTVDESSFEFVTSVDADAAETVDAGGDAVADGGNPAGDEVASPDGSQEGTGTLGMTGVPDGQYDGLTDGDAWSVGGTDDGMDGPTGPDAGQPSNGVTDPMAAIEGALVDELDPDIEIPTVAADRLGVPVDDLATREDPVEEVMPAPKFIRPMYEALVDVGQEYLLPGVDEVPKNSVGVVETNPPFVEAYVVGLNHEMARELRWRRFPCDRRGTYFDRFWDRIDVTGTQPPDVEPLHTWDTNALGENSPGEDITRAVLLIRGQLLKQYPNTVVYATKAVEEDGDRKPFTHTSVQDDAITRDDAGDVVKFPVFRGTLDPDVTFLGFDLTPEAAVNDPYHEETTPDPDDHDDEGWFFVLEEPPGAEETRFGLDVGQGDVGETPPGITGDGGSIEQVPEDDAGSEHGWSALSWGHLTTGDAVDQGAYVDVDGSRPGQEGWTVEAGTSWVDANDPPDGWTFDAGDAAEWGRNGAHMARITFQQPVRVAIHADDMLPDEHSGGAD